MTYHIPTQAYDPAIHHKLYIQLQPSAESIADLQSLQSRILAGPQARSVPLAQLHLTIIHFGKIDEVYDKLYDRVGLSAETYRQALQTYITTSQQILIEAADVEPYLLQPLSWAAFGGSGRTLVIRYQATATLRQLHADCLRALQILFTDCGVSDVANFMVGDHNFRYALTLDPHVTLFKSSTAELPAIKLPPLRLTSMPILYD